MATVIPQVSIQDLVFNKSTPNILGSLQAGLNLSGTFQDQQRATRQEQALLGQQQLAGQASQGLLSGQGPTNPQAMAQLLASNPEMADKMLKNAGVFNANSRRRLADTAFEARNIPFGPQRDAFIQNAAAQIQASGGDPRIATSLLGMTQEQQDKNLNAMEISALNPKDRIELAGGGKPTALQNNLIAAGFEPGTPAYQNEIMKSLRKNIGTTVNVGGNQLTPEQQIELESRKSASRTEAEMKGKNIAKRRTADIETGLVAAQTMPVLRRSLDLLKDIKTGGIDAAILKAKQFLGIESANEAELMNSLRKSVLSQLKPTFGAAFTAQEGKLLEDIEAGFGKSTAGNIRLIERALASASRRAQMGFDAALSGDDKRTAENIQRFIEQDEDLPTSGGTVIKFDRTGKRI